MKRLTLLLAITALGTFLAGTAASRAGVYVGIGVGGPYHSYYHGGYGGWCARPAVVVADPYYCYPPPTVVYTNPAPVAVVQAAPTVVQAAPAPAPVATDASAIPYGFVQSGGVLKSPYSGFTISMGGRSSGDIVYDANNGKAFRVP